MPGKVNINRLTNANVYINGISFLGRAEEINLPEVSPKMTDHKALGMYGEMELPAGLGKLSCKIKWNAPYPEVMTISHNPYKSHRLMVRSSLENWEAGGRVNELPVVVYMTGIFKKAGGLALKAQDNAEMEHELNITRYVMEIAGVTIVEIDVTANIWIAAGEDILANYRKNVGA